MAEIDVFVTAAEVFPDQPGDLAALKSLLSRLSRTDVLFCCCRINHLLTNRSAHSRWERQIGTVQSCFDDVGLYRISEAIKSRGEDHRAVFFRAQLLELMRWAALVCKDFPEDGATFESPTTRQVFGRAALVASSIWSHRIYGDLRADTDDIEVLRERTIGPFRKGVEGTISSPGLEVLGRGWRIFVGLISDIAPDFGRYFQSITRMTVEQYYVCCGALIAEFMRTGSDATIFDCRTLGESTRDPELIQRYLALESQTPDDLRVSLWGKFNADNIPESYLKHYDYKPLREKPLIRTSDGRTTIIDTVFMSEKASLGPLFHVLAGAPEEKVKYWFGSFGMAFERYVREILREAIPKPSSSLVDPLAFGLEGKGSGGAFEVDAYLNYGHELIVFETKAVWLREVEFAPGSSESLLSLLRKKYVVAEEGNKAIGQLTKIASAICRSEWLGRDGEFKTVQKIVPVLLVYDRLLESPGCGHFLAKEFEREFGPDRKESSGEMLKGTRRVAQLIVMTIDDIELLEVSSEHFGIRECLADYADAHPDRMLSFHHFLSTSPKYLGQLYASRTVARAGIEAMEQGLKILFGIEADELRRGSNL